MHRLIFFLSIFPAAALAQQAAVAPFPDNPRHTISVLEFGAKGDTTTDNTAAFQSAIDAAFAQGGGIVTVPAGSYRFDGTLRIPANVTLRGTFTAMPDNSYRGKNADFLAGRTRFGSTLLVYAGRNQPDAAPFIELTGANAGIDGFTFFYPEWDPKIIPPIPYPPTVAIGKMQKIGAHNTSIQNCFFENSYEALHIVHAGRHLVRNITGHPIKRGIYIDQIWDIGRVENVHFFPFSHPYSVNDPYSQWINKNGVAIECGFSDWQSFVNCFSFGYGIGFKFSASQEKGDAYQRGGCGKLIACGVDSADQPLLFEAAYSHWLISEGEFVGRWGSNDTTAVTIKPDVKAQISFSNCAFWGPIARVALMDAPGGTLSLANCQIKTWDDSIGAIEIRRGKAILQGNNFDREGRRQLVVGPEAGDIAATGNLAAPFFEIIQPTASTSRRQLLLAANSADNPAANNWPENARRHYIIRVGKSGDIRFLDNWNGPDTVCRWSRDNSIIRLPVPARQAAAVILRTHIPPQAINESSGIYLNTRRLLALEKSGDQALRIELAPDDTKDGFVTLNIRAATWIPAERDPNSTDHRVLGLSLSEIELIAAGAETLPAFDPSTQ